VPSSATRVPVAWCAGVVTVAVGVAGSGWSISPNRNISVSIRCTIALITDWEIVPPVMASTSGVPKYVLNGCSWSSPANAPPAVLCSAP
jgi:hypothetical protein